MNATVAPTERTLHDVVSKDWPQVLVSSALVIVIFGGVDILSKMKPGSPWIGILAGIPTGLLSAYFVETGDMQRFLVNYSHTCLALTITIVAFAFYTSARGSTNIHRYIPGFIVLWFLINMCFVM